VSGIARCLDETIARGVDDPSQFLRKSELKAFPFLHVSVDSSTRDYPAGMARYESNWASEFGGWAHIVFATGEDGHGLPGWDCDAFSA
jgi:hypothetical protein